MRVLCKTRAILSSPPVKGSGWLQLRWGSNMRLGASVLLPIALRACIATYHK